MIRRFSGIMLFGAILIAITGCGRLDKATDGLEFVAEDGTYVVNSYSGEEVDIYIPDTYNDIPVTAIGEDCFANSEIQSVTIGENVEEIRAGAFYNATMLKEVHIPAAVKRIGLDDSLAGSGQSGVFVNCISLEKVVFDKDSSLDMIGFAAFEDCDNLSGIVLPETINYIGSLAFAHCTSIKEIDIPATVSYMGKQVFAGFTTEQTINVLGDTSEWLYTGTIEYYGITVENSWTSNCDAVIYYKKGME